MGFGIGAGAYVPVRRLKTLLTVSPEYPLSACKSDHCFSILSLTRRSTRSCSRMVVYGI